MRLVKLYTFTFLGKKKIILTGPYCSSGPKNPKSWLIDPLFIIQYFTMAWDGLDELDDFEIRDNGELAEEVDEEEEAGLGNPVTRVSDMSGGRVDLIL